MAQRRINMSRLDNLKNFIDFRQNKMAARIQNGRQNAKNGYFKLTLAQHGAHVHPIFIKFGMGILLDPIDNPV